MTDPERAFEENPDALTEETEGPDRVTRAERHALSAAEQERRVARRKPSRSEVRRTSLWTAVAVSAAMSAASIVISVLAAHQTAAVQRGQEQVTADNEQNRALAQKAYDSARDANTRLAERGQSPVPVPPPNSSNPTDTIAAAAAAIVLANLPAERMPTTGQVAKGVADYMATHAVAPAGPGDIFPVVATYLAQNPPPAGATGDKGAPGDKGEKGDPPSEADIQAAFISYVQDNPNWLPMALCQGRGDFGQAQDLVLADGGRISGYLCITGRTPPPGESTTTTTTDGGLLKLPGN